MSPCAPSYAKRMSEPDSRFDASRIAHLDEPVRRYFTHALGPEARLRSAVRLRMEGRIKVGTWLPFDATWRGDGRSFEWRARAGWLRPLHVVDRYESGQASMDVRLLGRLRMVHATGEDTIRSAAGRTAVESVGKGWCSSGIGTDARRETTERAQGPRRGAGRRRALPESRLAPHTRTQTAFVSV